MLADSELLAGRYAFRQELGRGASGRVILAADTAAGEELRAVKLVTEPQAERLRWEFQLLSRIAHPNVARVFELFRVESGSAAFGAAPGTAALVQQYAPGRAADQAARSLARDGDALLALALQVGESVARALGAIHAQGLVHGDVKPGNIVVAEGAAAGERGGVKLIDLDLARPPAVTAALSGTPGFMAPEVWRGELGPAADLYALGATLARLLVGAPAESERSTARSGAPDLLGQLRRSLDEPGNKAPLPDRVPAPARRLIHELLSPDPDRRPSSAGQVAARFGALRVELGGRPAGRRGRVAVEQPELSPQERAMAVSALPLAGQAEALERLLGALDAAFERGDPSLICVSGPPGSGRSRLVREAVYRLQSSRLQAQMPAFTYRSESALPAGPLGHDCVLHVTGGDEIDPGAATDLTRAAAVEGYRACVVLEGSRPPPDEVASVQLGPLDDAAVERLLGAALSLARVPSSLVEAAREVSAGLAGRLCRLLADGLAAGRELTRPAVLREQGADASPDQTPIPASGRWLVELLACAGGRLPLAAVIEAVGEAGEVPEAVRSLLAAGMASQDAAGWLWLRPDLRAGRRAGAETLRTAEKLLSPSLDAAASGYIHLALGRKEEALGFFTRAIQASRKAGDPERAARLAADAQPGLRGLPGAGQLALFRADALRACGRYGEALAALGRAGEAEAALLRAELHRLRGELGPAEQAARGLARKLQGAEDGGAMAEALGALGARIALDSGQNEQARELAERIDGEGAPLARALEVLALIDLSQGEGGRAREAAERALALGQRLDDRRVQARSLSLLASISLNGGDVHGAARLYSGAFELAEQQGEYHAAASFLVNLGLARLDAAEPGPALGALREGARRLARIGRESDMARALYNLGNAAALIGEDELALAAVEQSRLSEAARRDPVLQAYARIVEAEVRLRRGEKRALSTLIDELLPLASVGADRDRAVIGARIALLQLGIGDTDGAERSLTAALQAAQRDGSPAAMVECALSESQVALALGDRERARGAASRASALARSAGTFEVVLRAALGAAHCEQAAGNAELGAAFRAEARSLLDRAALSLTPRQRARLRLVEAYGKALQSAPERPGAAPAFDDRWRRLAALAKRLTAERRPARLYEVLLDAAVELTGAERGFVVLLDRQGRQRMRAARGLGRRDLEREQQSLSRSIVSRVIGEGRPLFSTDALADERLDAAASVHALSLRSVLCVPMRQRGEVVGAILVDDRIRPFAFGEPEALLLGDLADLGAIALDGAELLRAERRGARRLELLRERLARTVEQQAVELSSLKRSVPGPGPEHPSIVAESAAMRRVMQMTERVSRSDLPVLILGESGTGKELVARAIHDWSGRAGSRFVSENCGAIPETLLESTLFGHVKGSFTGADRRRLGLFEMADGGTLFLDEIGEMSPAMQSRLLRALEEGEIRPVGSERTRKVDVRVLAATHRDLGAMVAQGAFREDLYYRLAVVTLEIPPLRERPEDIPALAAHLLGRQAEGRSVRMDRKALSALGRQSWPGNVRQLQNELSRALVLADDVIRLEHLACASPAGEAEPVGDLDLRGQVGILERKLIRRALDQAGGNQTRAAKLLGVSRYGLQKMIKRLGDIA